MTVRITTTVSDSRTVLKIDGWLKAEDVEELGRAYQSVPGSTMLDLSEMHSADREGVALLRQLLSLGAEVCGAAPYIELLLRIKPRPL